MKAKGKSTEAPGKFEKLLGTENISDVSFVDQSPIGKTTRSTPALFMGAFETIRRLFAASPEAKKRKYEAGTFSFNSGTGRCPACSGSGFEHIEMQFLSDVYLSCPECKGSRYRSEILEVKLSRNGKEANIAEVLDMTIAEALDFFKENKEIVRNLEPLVKVGLTISSSASRFRPCPAAKLSVSNSPSTLPMLSKARANKRSSSLTNPRPACTLTTFSN